MRPFSFSHDQICRVVANLISEELSGKGIRNFDSLTVANWDGETSIGASGIGLSDAEREICANRIELFFGGDFSVPLDFNAVSISQWSDSVLKNISKYFRYLSFTPAGRDAQAPASVHLTETVFQDGASAANIFVGRRRLLSLVAPHGAMGFVLTIVTPNLQQIPTIDARSMTPDELQESLRFGDVLVATPTLWRYIMQEGVNAPDNTMGVSFGEPLTRELSVEMRQAGFSALREVYGSTETGLIGWRDDPVDEFVLFDQWQREADSLLRICGQGKSAPISSMDVMKWSSERRFVLAGRRDGATQVGAINVFPERIAKVLSEHHDVDECIIRVGENYNGVNRLIAHIVLKDKSSPTEKRVREIDAWCRKKMRPQERPRIYHFEATLDPFRD